MRIEDLLLDALELAIPGLWLVFFIMLRAAIRGPRVRFLEVSTIQTFLIAAAITAYVLAIRDSQDLHLFGIDTMRIVLRTILFAIAFFPFWWLYLYWTRRFRDGHR